MHELTINLEALLWIAGLIVALGGAGMYIKKGASPVLRPYNEMKSNVKMLVDRKKSCDAKFEHDAEELAEIKQDIRMVMKTEMLILKHIETGNCTGEIAAGRAAIEKYLIDKK